MSSTHEIVLLGANMGGVQMAHYLLKHTIPQLSAIDSSRSFHLTIVSPNTDYYWKIAAPRVLLDNKQIPTTEVVKPISELFSQYSPSLYEHILGKATDVEPSTKSITISGNDGSQQTITYDSLIIATGAHYKSAIWTTEHGIPALKDAYTRLHTNLPRAKTVLIAGGGPVGVETAGEIAVTYPNAKVTLYSGTKRVLDRIVPERISVEAEKQLKSLGVSVVHRTRVTGPETASGAGEAATVTFDDGTSKTADVYINAVGSAKNTSFLPTSWLDEKNKGVKADRETLRATGPGAANVYVVGDANANSNGQSSFAQDGVRPVASALAIDVLKNSVAGGAARRGGKKSGVGAQQQSFKTMEGAAMVPIGKSGTGIMFGWKAPGWFVHAMKGKGYFVNMMGPQITGASMAKE